VNAHDDILEDSTASESTRAQLRTWLKDCETHEFCKNISAKRGSFTPKRLLDLGENKDSKAAIRIVECETDVEDKSPRYMTLRYV
jgi:hypothetical protein